MGARTDIATSDYAFNVPVVNGTVWYGQPIIMLEAFGVSAHCQLTNGAAGSFTSQVSNYGGDFVPSSGIPWSQLYSDTVSANGQKFSGISSTQAGEAMGRFFRWIFTPTASGNLYIAVNVRKISQ